MTATSNSVGGPIGIFPLREPRFIIAQSRCVESPSAFARMPPRPQPEAAAREHIDALVVAAGWATRFLHD